jgi:hypothetical protein
MSAIEGFETVGDIVAAGRQREGRVLDIESKAAPYTYRDLCTNVWKAGNLFTHYGVHVEGDLAVAIGPKATDSGRDEAGYLDSSEPLLAVLGGTLVGGAVDLSLTEPVEESVLVAPAHWAIDVAPGCTHLAYGGPPTDPNISHFERNVWSENPIEPPESVDPGETALQAGDGEAWTHADVLGVADRAITETDIGPESQIRLLGRLTDPSAVVAGIVVPMAAGATIVVSEERHSQETGAEETLVVTGDGSADREITRNAVMDWLHETRRA